MADAGYQSKAVEEQKMKYLNRLIDMWPEDPAWPDPPGDDPYDLGL